MRDTRHPETRWTAWIGGLIAAAALLAAPAGAYSPTDRELENPVHEAQPRGALTGASVFLSPGHGWLWNQRLGRWVTQRGVSHGVIEDHSNAEIAFQYTVRYLWNAGARVYTTRERCMNPNMVIVQPGGAGFSMHGPWSNEHVRGAYAGTQLVVPTVIGDEPTAEAHYTPDIPEDGYYGVYVWYRPTPEGRTNTAARITVNHTGASTTWVQNQNHDGHTWKYIGQYYFEAGTDPVRGSVTIDNLGPTTGTMTIAGAVRFGGGMGDTIRNGATSGKPRWEESALYYGTFMGYDPSRDTRFANIFNSVGALSMWAEWEMEPWEKGKSIYVSCHTNASATGQSRGMFSFVYGPDPWEPLTRFTGHPYGLQLVRVVHDEVMDHVHAFYDPEWRDGAKITRWLGETNPRNNAVMPAALFEYGFHDNVDDARYILDPKFRDTVAKATYQGIVKFYQEHMEGFDNGTFLPESPTHLHVITTQHGAEIRWNEPPYRQEGLPLGDRATGYRVYTSRNGKGFDNGTAVTATFMRLSNPSSEPLFVRVTAVNEGGESMPTETLAIRGTTDNRVLIVNGFDRLDGDMNLVQPDRGQRGILARMNSFDYSVQHGQALAAADVDFDSASNEAVAEGLVSLDNYKAVVYIAGQENNGGVLPAGERQLVQDYLSAGGALFISGAYIATDLAEHAPAFLRETLGVRLDNPNADTHTASGAPGSSFENIPSFTFERGNEGTVYPVRTPEALETYGRSQIILRYDSGLAAAIRGGAGNRVIALGFPFETIHQPEARAAIMKHAMASLMQQGGN